MALHITMEIPGDPAAIEAALEGLIGMNVVLMGQRSYPPLYSTSIRYRLERPGRDDWQTCDRLYASGEGDCEDVVGVRVAELRRQGESGARPRVVPVPGRDDAFHTFVQRQDGTMEDPSKIMIYKEEQTMDNKPTICVRDVGGHTLGVVELPLRDGRKATVQQLGFDAWGAIATAFHEITSNPGLMALISPQAAVAIQVAKRISDMSPDDLKKLQSDPKATDAQKKLAKEIAKSPAKQAAPGAAPAAAESKSDWSILPKGANLGEMKAPPYYGPGAPPVVRVHTGGTQSTPSRATQANLTPVPGMTHSGANVVPIGASTAAGGGTSSSSSSITGSGTRVDPGSSGGGAADTNTAPIDPNTGAYMAPDGTPYIWVPGTDQNHPGHWMRQSSFPGGVVPTPAMPPGIPPGYGVPPGYPPPGYPGYPGGMMPPSYPPGMMPPSMPPGYGYPPPFGVDPSAYGFGYPYPYGAPYGYGGSPMTPYMPPGWWGGMQGQAPEPLSLDEAAAVTVWGAQSFAEGSFPGYI